MIKFWFSQIDGKITCGDCSLRDMCKEVILSTQICPKFKREKVKPEVRSAPDDYDQLIRQLSLWNATAEGIRKKHVNHVVYGFEKPGPEEPTVSECDTFVEINRIFMKYLDEQKEMLKKSKEVLKILLQTTYSVDEKKHEVRIYTEDRLLVDDIIIYLRNTTYSLRNDTYENIVEVGKRSR